MHVRFLLSKTTRRILYMEAGKEIVETLLSFVHVPMETAFRILYSENTETDQIPQVGSVSKLYSSLRKLKETGYAEEKLESEDDGADNDWEEEDDNDEEEEDDDEDRCDSDDNNDEEGLEEKCSGLTEQKGDAEVSTVRETEKEADKKNEIVLTSEEEQSKSKLEELRQSWASGGLSLIRAVERLSLFRCQACSSKNPDIVATVCGTECPFCKKPMTEEAHDLVTVLLQKQKLVPLSPPVSIVAGDRLWFTVTDDLSVMPSSSVLSMSLLNKLNFHDISDLHVFEATISFVEILSLLKASLTSSNALNAVFADKVNHLVL